MQVNADVVKLEKIAVGSLDVRSAGLCMDQPQIHERSKVACVIDEVW